MLDIGTILDSVSKVVQLLTVSPESTLLTIFGFGLLIVAGILAYWTPQTKSALIVSLIGGILFAAAGPGVALLKVEKNTIRKMDADQAFRNLRDNAEVNYVIRLISYDPQLDAALAIDRLTNLGAPDQLYSFVADYDELVGYNVIDALAKTGQSTRNVKRVSAIIFPLRTPIFPANALGLLQVIEDVEKRRGIQTQLKKKLLDGTGAFDEDAMKKLVAATSIDSYRWLNYKDSYPRYCELAHEFQCGGGDPTYSAKAYIGALSKDWHPLGFSIRHPNGPPDDRCKQLSLQKYCDDWETTEHEYRDQIGSRVFLIRNLEIHNIPGRIMIDFDQPAQQVIPDIGAR
jgi:hypothetical protein